MNKKHQEKMKKIYSRHFCEYMVIQNIINEDENRFYNTQKKNNKSKNESEK